MTATKWNQIGLRCAQLISAVILLSPFIPIKDFAGELRGTRYNINPHEWVLGVIIVLPFAWLGAVLLPQRLQAEISARTSRFLSTPARVFVPALLLVLAAALTTSSFSIIRNRPDVIDSTVQYFQAQIFALGRFAVPAPKHIAFFVTQHLLMDETGWYGQYPPGHSLLLAIGILLRAPWAIGVALSVATVWSSYYFVREAYDRETATLSSLLLAFSPFFFFMGTSFMNHCSALTFASLFLYTFVRWSKRPQSLWMLLCGISFGFLCLSRPLTGIAIAVPFGIAALVLLVRTRAWTSAVFGIAGVAPTVAIGLVYNHFTTGDAFLSGYIKLWGSAHGLGFHKGPFGDVHTPILGFWNELTEIALLNRFLFEWPIPSLFPLALFFLLPVEKRRWDLLLLLGFLAVPACYFFYWFRGKYLGPRYLYETLVFVVPLTARGILVCRNALKQKSFRLPHLFHAVPLSAVFTSLVVISIGYQLFFGVPVRVYAYYNRHLSSKVDLIDEARARGIDNAIIFVANPWGERLLANLRELGLTAAMGEEAYRTVDHCLLQDIADRGRSGALAPENLRAEVQTLIDARMNLVNPNLNGDPTLKIRPNVRLSARCVDEIQYDAPGYEAYFPHLILNDPLLRGPIIIARDLRERNSELLADIPGRKGYLYRKHEFTPL